jgi:prepilin-type N-terminal cleavage/methylation domain-containing protein
MARHRTNRGFTLIELLVVIAIIAILVTMLVPAIKLVRRQASQASAAQTMRQIGLCVSSYSLDWDNFLPGPMNGGSRETYYALNNSLGSYLWSYMDAPKPPPAATPATLPFLKDRYRESVGYVSAYVRTNRYYPAGGTTGPYFDPCGYPGAGTYPHQINEINQPGENIFFQDASYDNYATSPWLIPATAFYGHHLSLYYDNHVE